MRLLHAGYLVGLFAAIAACWTVEALAQSSEALYRVEGIEVSETADNAVAAQQTAMEDGKRRGLISLLERLTAPADRNRLPSFEGVPVDRYVQNFDVVDERVSGTVYEADLTVTYLAEPVQGLLRGIGIPFAIRRSEPVLIIPATRTENRLELWQGAGPWTEAWYQIAEAPGLMTLVLPLGDLEDVSTLGNDDVIAGRTEGAAALASRYGASRAILAIATTPQTPDAPGAAPGGNAADGNDAGLGEATMPERVMIQAVSLDDTPTTIIAETIRLDELGEDRDIYVEAAELVVRALEDDWKSTNIVRLDVVQSLDLAVPLSDLNQWVAVRRALEETPEIRTIRIDSLGRSRAELSLDYVGSEDKLRDSLERRGQTLIAGEGGPVLYPSGAFPGQTSRPLGRAQPSGAGPTVFEPAPAIEQSPIGPASDPGFPADGATPG